MRGSAFASQSTEQSLARLDMLAKLMDGAFVIPGTGVRIGLDGIIGVVPVAGDVISGIVSSYLIWEAHRLGAPKFLIWRMVVNTLIDTTLGSVPLIGDAFDVLFRANMMNMALLRGHLERQGFVRRGGPQVEGQAVRMS